MNKEYLEGMKTAIEDCEKNGFDWVVSITVNTNHMAVEIYRPFQKRKLPYENIF